jgi:hypothetical protein
LKGEYVFILNISSRRTNLNTNTQQIEIWLVGSSYLCFAYQTAVSILHIKKYWCTAFLVITWYLLKPAIRYESHQRVHEPLSSYVSHSSSI